MKGVAPVGWSRMGAGLALVAALALAGPLALPAGAAEFQPAAADPAAQTEQARRYEHAEGVPRDYGRAVRLYCTAAWAGHAQAQYQLGWMYANGRGVARDDVLAAAWFQMAARQGDALAARMLRYLGADGAGPPRCVLPNGDVFLEVTPDPSPRHIRRWVTELAPAYGLDARLVLAVIRVESAFNPRAQSHKHAKGLMQLLPGTAARFGVADIWDPVQNIQGGMAYLRWLLDHFGGDVRLALAGYNAGERAVRRHGGVPPYAETRRYVRKVLGLWRGAGAVAGASLENDRGG